MSPLLRKILNNDLREQSDMNYFLKTNRRKVSIGKIFGLKPTSIKIKRFNEHKGYMNLSEERYGKLYKFLNNSD